MKIVPLTQSGIHANWFPLDAKYVHDELVLTRSQTVQGSDNLQLVLDQSFVNVNDSTVNNHSAMFLTEQKSAKDFIELSTPTNDDTTVFTTTLLVDNEKPRHLSLPEQYTDPTQTNITQGLVEFRSPIEHRADSQSIAAHDNYFEVILDNRDNKTYAQIFHESSRNNRNELYTLQHAGDNVGFYRIGKTQSKSAIKSTHYLNNKFECLVDYQTSTMILLIPTEDTTAASRVVRADTTNSQLKSVKVTSPDDITNPHNLIQFKHNLVSNEDIQQQSFDNNWVVYKDKVNNNHVNISETSTITNIPNNFLINSEFENSDNMSIPIDLIPLKNQQSIQSDNVVHDPYRRRTGTVRQYDKLFTGTNEINGYDDINIGFTSYLDKMEMEPGKLTYFHVSRELYPVDRLNVNDCGLIESGSIAGDTPLRADKIFKKRAGYDQNTNHGQVSDEKSGKWLCSWLYKDPATGSPVWVDRYYQPDLISGDAALKKQVEQPVITYNTQYTTRNQSILADDVVYDKKSDLCFEPGGLYAYYHIGMNDVQHIVNNITEHAVALQGSYITDINTIQTSEMVTDIVIDLDQPTPQYAAIYIPKNRDDKSNLTVSVTLSSQDWSKPFGNVVMGNYIDRGFNIINKRIISPIQLFRTGQEIIVYNNDFERVNTINMNTTNFRVVETEYFQSLAVLVEERDDAGVARLYIHRYSTMSPFIMNRHLIDDEWETRGVSLSSASVKTFNDNAYIVDNVNTGTYMQINTIDMTMYHGLSASWLKDMNDISNVEYYANNIIPTHDQVFIFDDMMSRVDGSGNIWFVADNARDIYKYDTDTELITGEVRLTESSTQSGFPMSVYFPGEQVVDIKFDQKNDLWILYKHNNLFKCKKIAPDRENSAFKQVLAHIDLETPDTSGEGNDWHYDKFFGWTYTAPAKPKPQNQILTGHWQYVAQLNMWFYKSIDSDWYYSETLQDWLYVASLQAENTIYMDFVFDTDEDSVYFVYDGEYDRENIINNTVLYSNTREKFTTGKELLAWSDRQTAQDPDDIQWQNIQNLTGSTSPVPGEPVENLYQLIKLNSTSLPGSLIEKYDLNGEFVSSKKITQEINIADLHKQDVSGLQYLLPSFYKFDSSNYLFMKTRLVNPVDVDDIVEVTLQTHIADLQSGTHDLVMTGDAENGALSLYIDGVLRSQKRFDDFRYRFDELLDKTIYIGTSPGVKGLPLYHNLNRYTGLDVTNLHISNLHVYNTALFHYEIENIHRLHTGIKTILWHHPSGVRNYIDTVSKTYRQATPGRKSNYYDINIRTDTLSSQEIMERITRSLQEKLNEFTPANMNTRDINWSDPIPNQSIQAMISKFDQYFYYKDCDEYPEIVPSPTPTVVPFITSTPLPEPTPTSTAIDPDNLPTPFPTLTPQPTPSPTATLVPTLTPVQTLPPTPTPTSTPVPTPTVTPTATPTATPLPPLDPCDGFEYSVLIDQQTVEDHELAFFAAPIGARVCHFGASGGAAGATTVALDGVKTFRINIAGTVINNLIKYISPDGVVYQGVINTTGGDTLLLSS